VAAALSPATLLEGMQAGVCAATGVARSMPVELLEEAGVLGRFTLGADIKAMMLAAPGMRQLHEDVMLYAFLLTADPGMATLQNLAEKYLDRKLESAIEQQADCILSLAEKLRPDVERFRKVYDGIDLPLV